MRFAVLALLLSLVVAPGASADVRLSSASTSVRALAAADGVAYVVLDGPSDSEPFRLVRSGGSTSTGLGTFGDKRSEDPAVAAGPSGALISWTQPVTSGLAVLARPVDRSRPEQLALGTGTAPLAVRADGAAVAAFPDRTGDAAVAIVPAVFKRSRGPYDLPDMRRLSADAPEHRHRPLAVTVTEAGPLVLDQAQTRTRTTLRVLGEDAPSGTLLTRRGLRVIHATLAADADTIAVAFASGGHARLATAKPGGTWRTRTLPGSAVRGAPAVALDDGEPVVVWTAHPRGLPGRELFAWSGGLRRLTRTRGDEGQPYVAALSAGGIFAAWTRRDGTRAVPLLRRL